jgi:hypothetical protein
MKKMLIGAAVAATLFAGHAEATPNSRQWWVLDFGEGTCHTVEGRLTPDSFIQWQRNDSKDFQGVPDVNVVRDDNGVVAAVRITNTFRNGRGLELVFTANQTFCEALRQEYAKQGQIIDHNELN